jgi:hypothetical protein
MGLDSDVVHRASLETSERIVPDLSHVSGGQAPFPAREHGAGDLASGQDFGYPELNLGVEGREVREPDDCIGGVQSYADNVNDWNRIRHGNTLRKKVAAAKLK